MKLSCRFRKVQVCPLPLNSGGTSFYYYDKTSVKLHTPKLKLPLSSAASPNQVIYKSSSDLVIKINA